jgi:hypothetical protein
MNSAQLQEQLAIRLAASAVQAEFLMTPREVAVAFLTVSIHLILANNRAADAAELLRNAADAIEYGGPLPGKTPTH